MTAQQPQGEQRSADPATQAALSSQRLTLTIPEACEALGVGETMLRQMMRAGQLPTLRLGRRVLIPRQAVEQLVARACAGPHSSQITTNRR